MRSVPTASSLLATGSEIVLCGNVIAKYSAATGALVWSRDLGSAYVDVAVDAPGVYFTAMLAVHEMPREPYYAVGKLEHATGAVAWLRQTAGYRAARPTLKLAIVGEALFLFGYQHERWFVERRTKANGAVLSTADTEYRFDAARSEMAR